MSTPENEQVWRLLRELSATEDGESVLAEITSAMAQRKAASIDRHNSPETVTRLRRLRIDLERRHTFAVGDVVRWKQGLKNKSHPAYGSPAVVVEVLSVPVLNPTESAGSVYFREPLDLVIGYFLDDDPDGERLRAYHVDGRRFEPYVDTAEELR